LYFYISERYHHLILMKHSIVSTLLLTLTIALTITATSTNPNMAFAIENYLQLRSANVNHHSGDIDVDIRTGGNIHSEKGNSGFGYAVLTDVGDEFVNNVLVAITDIGLDDYDKSKNDKLHTHVLDWTGDVSSDCSGSDYEVDRSSSDNEAFDTNYPIDVKGNKISIDNIGTDDLASDTVKAIASFTADAVTHNGKIQHICIDIQDVLKQSEISISYDDNNSGNGDDDDKDTHKDNDKNRKDRDDDTKKDDKVQDDCDIGDNGFPFCDGRPEEKESTEDGDDCDIGDNGFPFCDGRDEKEDMDDSSGIDIDQDIDQSNTCSGSASCRNEGSNLANVGGGSSSSSDSDGFGIDIDQAIDQSNACGDEADCSNEGKNEANIWDDSGSDKTGIDIGQSIQQSNECDGEASCSNEGSNEANVLGYPSISDDEEFGSDIDIGQSIEQSNTCSGGATCSNQASNVANIG
jgi:hypothetical protein